MSAFDLAVTLIALAVGVYLTWALLRAEDF
ncbi:MAG: potassium-transporting ATPase subunit F [Chloroflexota bacterium]